MRALPGDVTVPLSWGTARRSIATRPRRPRYGAGTRVLGDRPAPEDIRLAGCGATQFPTGRDPHRGAPAAGAPPQTVAGLPQTQPSAEPGPGARESPLPSPPGQGEVHHRARAATRGRPQSRAD